MSYINVFQTYRFLILAFSGILNAGKPNILSSYSAAVFCRVQDNVFPKLLDLLLLQWAAEFLFSSATAIY